MTGRQPQLLILHQSFNMAKTLARLLAGSYGVYIARETSQVLEILETKEIRMLIASQQLPDGTGMDFLASISESHPEIIRMLLLPGGADGQSAEQAVSDGTIHFFMVEPLSSSGFLEMVHKGMRLYPETEKDVPDERLPTAHEHEDEITAEPEDRDYSEAERVEDASRNLDRLAAERSKREEFDRVCADKDARIEQLEAACAQLRQDKEMIQSQLVRMSEDSSALAVVRKENEAYALQIADMEAGHAGQLADMEARYAGQIVALDAEKEELENRLAQAEERFEALEAEVKAARNKLSSLGFLVDAPDEGALSTHDRLHLPDPEDIYDRAEEWLLHIKQLHRINSTLVAKIERDEKDIQELHGRIEQDQSRYNEELGKLKRHIREYQAQLSQMRDNAEKQEMRSQQLLRENEGLSQKLDWMQSQWKESVAHSSTEG